MLHKRGRQAHKALTFMKSYSQVKSAARQWFLGMIMGANDYAYHQGNTHGPPDV